MAQCEEMRGSDKRTSCVRKELIKLISCGSGEIRALICIIAFSKRPLRVKRVDRCFETKSKGIPFPFVHSKILLL